jgi:hypothetical protein
VVDEVLYLMVVGVVLASDGLPSSIGYNIIARCSEGWSGVPADHVGPMEDLHDFPELFLPWTRDSLDSVLWLVVIPT